jgi:hypothetical protein
LWTDRDIAKRERSSITRRCIPDDFAWTARVAAGGRLHGGRQCQATYYRCLMYGKLGLCPQPSPDFVEDKPLAEASQLFHYKVESAANKTHGRGANKVAKPAINAVAPTVPNLSYNADANNGNTHPKQLLKKLLLASTEAEMGRYAVTRYVNVDENAKQIPIPTGMDPMMGTIQ